MTQSMPFHFINQQWHCLSGSRLLFVIITFTKLRGLSTLEKSCRFNSSYTKSILDIHDDFAAAFLKNFRSCTRVSGDSYFLQKSGRERTCIVSGGPVCLHLQGEAKTP